MPLIKKAYRRGPGLNIYKPAYQIVLETERSYNKGCPPRKYDPVKAKQLLAEAGYPNGFSFKFLYQNDTWRDGVIGVQNDLAKIGIKMEAQPISAAAYVKIRLKGEVDPGLGCQMNTAIYGDPLFTIDYFWRTNSNEFHHVLKPAGIDDLIEKARSAKDEATKVKLTQDIVKLVYDDVTAVPVWVTGRAAILDRSVRNDQFFINGDQLNNRYDKVWLKK